MLAGLLVSPRVWVCVCSEQEVTTLVLTLYSSFQSFIKVMYAYVQIESGYRSWIYSPLTNDTARNKKTWFVLFSFLVHAGDSNVCSGQYIRTNLSLLANLFVCVVVTVVSFWIGEREVYGQAGTNICDLVEYRRIAWSNSSIGDLHSLNITLQLPPLEMYHQHSLYFMRVCRVNSIRSYQQTSFASVSPQPSSCAVAIIWIWQLWKVT